MLGSVHTSAISRCVKSVAKPLTSTQRQQVSTGEKPFRCKDYSKAFKQKVSLNQYQWIQKKKRKGKKKEKENPNINGSTLG